MRKARTYLTYAAASGVEVVSALGASFVAAVWPLSQAHYREAKLSNALQFFDAEHSEEDEERFLMLGLSHRSRILIVCHCEREDGNVIRLISARKATANERQHYKGPMS